MLENLCTLKQFSCVSGAEGEIAKHLICSLLRFGIHASQDKMGNVIATVLGRGKIKKKILICVPMDVPGLVALYKENDHVFLSPTGSISKKIVENTSLLDETNSLHKLLKENGEFFISSEKTQLGDTFRPDGPLTQTKEKIKGWMCTRFALLALLTEITHYEPENDLICAFTSGFETRAAREVNLAYEYSPDVVLLIGAVDEVSSLPVVMIREGKFLADVHEVKRLTQCGIKMKELVSAENITKAEEVFSHHPMPILSVALPCQNKGEINECFTTRAYEKLLLLLKKYL